MKIEQYMHNHTSLAIFEGSFSAITSSGNMTLQPESHITR